MVNHRLNNIDKEGISDRKKILLIIALFILAIPFLSSQASAIPPLPTEFYGNISYFNDSVTSGTVTAYDTSGTSCGSFGIMNADHFGLLTCRGDDPFTLADEGPTSSETVDFYYNGNLMEVVIGDSTYNEGRYKEIWIIYPPLICGDAYCDDNFESCSICSADCGSCPTIPDNLTTNGTINGSGDINTTINITNTTIPPSDGGTGIGDGGGATEEGGATSGGSGAAGGGDTGATDGGSGDASGADQGIICEEDWSCLQWSICYANETQNRICIDLNDCKTTEKKPPTIQECMYEGDCFDDIQNGLEEGIDCGGFCKPCPWSTANATCFDGKQNQREEGVDCGGPCDKECKKPKPFIESPIEICKREYRYEDPTYWLFLLGIILAILTDSYLISKRIKKAKEDEELDDLEKAKIIIHSKRNRYIFIATIMAMSSILLSYYHYFSQCRSGLTDFLWVLIMVFMITPGLGFIIIKIFEYDERKKIRISEQVFESHHGNIKSLIAMHNQHLIEIENDISNDIYQLSADPELKEVLETYPKLKMMYKEMITLYDRYKEQANPIKIEKELCQNMYDLINSNDFVELTNKVPRVKAAYDNIVLLYKQYEEKQKMYDELFKNAFKNDQTIKEKEEKHATTAPKDDSSAERKQ